VCGQRIRSAQPFVVILDLNTEILLPDTCGHCLRELERRERAAVVMQPKLPKAPWETAPDGD
jgi:hypothetical protein